MSTQFRIDDRSADTNRLIDAAFDLVDDGLIVLDEAHCIRRLNRAAEALTGWSESDAYGAHWSVVLCILTDEEQTTQSLNATAPPAAGEHRVTLTIGDTATRRVRIRVENIEADHPRTLCGSVITLRDNDAELRTSEQRSDMTLERGKVEAHTDVTETRDQAQLLQFALESGHQGIWEWDVEADIFRRHGFWSPGMEAYDLGTEMSGEDLMERIHPDDERYMREVIVSYLRGDIESLAVELRLRRINGSYG